MISRKETNQFYESWRIVLFTIGFVLILIVSIYLFTRPAIISEFDLTNTGSIGDTIGGITSPIVNIIGAILIYASFQAQIRANKIQFSLLNREFENQGYDRNFQITLDLFRDLKNDFNNLNYKTYNGQAAINVFANDIKNDWSEDDFNNHCKWPIFNHLKFIISQYDLITTYTESAEMRVKEKKRISIMAFNYYSTQINYPTEIIVQNCEKFGTQLTLINLVKRFNKEHEKLLK